MSAVLADYAFCNTGALRAEASTSPPNSPTLRYAESPIRKSIPRTEEGGSTEIASLQTLGFVGTNGTIGLTSSPDVILISPNGESMIVEAKMITTSEIPLAATVPWVLATWGTASALPLQFGAFGSLHAPASIRERIEIVRAHTPRWWRTLRRRARAVEVLDRWLAAEPTEGSATELAQLKENLDASRRPPQRRLFPK